MKISIHKNQQLQTKPNYKKYIKYKIKNKIKKREKKRKLKPRPSPSRDHHNNTTITRYERLRNSLHPMMNEQNKSMVVVSKEQ